MTAALGFSFTDWNGVSPMEWIGFENYIQLTRDSRFWQSLKVTLVFTIFYLTLNIIIGFALALVMNQPVRGMRLFRTIYYLPAVLSGVAVAVLWSFLFHREFGALNWMLGLIGIKRIGWIVSESWALPSIIIMELWRVGSTIIIFLAGLQGIPPELYEAAEVDGANRRWRLWSITIPLMSPSIFFVLIVSFINTMQVFTQAYIMTRGGPNYATYFLLDQSLSHHIPRAASGLRLSPGRRTFCHHLHRHPLHTVGLALSCQLRISLGRALWQLITASAASKGKGGFWSRRKRLHLQNHVLTYLILVPGALLFLYPLLWMLSTSLKPKHQIFTYPIEWIPDTWMWSNYGEVFNQVPFLTYTINTAVITVIGVVGTLIGSSLAAYGFARFRFPGKDALFLLMLSTMMVPDLGDAHPLVLDVPLVRLAEFLSADSGAGLLRAALLHLPFAAVFHDGADRPGRRGAH